MRQGGRLMTQLALRLMPRLRCLLAVLAVFYALSAIAPPPAFAAQPALSCPAGTTVFDWDTPSNSWTAGSLNNSYSVANLGTINYAIATTGGTWVTNATYGGTAPFRQNVDTYGFSPVQYTLQEWIDFSTRTQTATTVITLPTAVPGLQFSLLDVDFSSGGFTDQITVTGSYGGSPVTPSLDTHNGTPSYTIAGNVATGNAGSTVTSQNGRIWVTFSVPVDTVTVVYGNAPSAPANPSSQAIDFHDITFCRPQAVVTATKISSVVSDPVSGSNPKAIPGATIRYCITVNNAGSGTATGVAMTDTIPANMTYIAGSMFSGATCGTATTAEDDNNAGADESDPIGMNISGTTITGTRATMLPGTSFVMVFNAAVN
jgi:uncharacterized repeat protein (TIGR01451 family)